jgi:hypothetical protein
MGMAEAREVDGVEEEVEVVDGVGAKQRSTMTREMCLQMFKPGKQVTDLYLGAYCFQL